MELTDLFEIISFSDGDVVEFPIDFHCCGIPKSRCLSINNQKGIVYVPVNNEGIVILDTPLNKDEITKFIPKLLIKVGQRDNSEIIDIEITRLFITNLMRAVLRDSGIRSLNLFYDKSYNLSLEAQLFCRNHGVKLYPCDMSVVGKDKVLLTPDKESGIFVIPEKNGKYGLAVLHTNRIIMGTLANVSKTT